MRAAFLFLVGFLLGACGQSYQPPAAAPAKVEDRAQDLTAKTVALAHLRPTGEAKSYCSGVWVSDTSILTAAHCVEGESLLLNYMVQDDVVAKAPLRVADVYAIDADHDLALMRASAPLPAHRVARVSMDVRAGQHVATMGHPLGLWWSYSDGSIAAIRKIDLEPEIIYVQTTAPTSRGNSGCGLWDDQGRLIGIAHAGMPQGSNLAFYIHGQYVDALLKRQGSL